jgi:hypothetical protein
MRIITIFFQWLSLLISGLGLFRNYNILERNNELNTFLSSNISEMIKYSMNDTDLKIGFFIFISFLIIFIILSKKSNKMKVNYNKKINKIYDIINYINNNGENISEDMTLLSKPEEPRMNGFFGLILMGILFIIVRLTYAILFERQVRTPVVDPVMLVLFLIILLISLYKLFKPSLGKVAEYEYQKAIYNNRLKLNEKFKSKFIILKDFDESKYANIKIININDRKQENAMFKIYIQAELLKANAIVLNDSNISTQVYGSVSTNSRGDVSGGTSSSNTFHFTVTLVKKINNSK